MTEDGKYMMATKATGGGVLRANLSREVPDLVIIHSEDENDYIGNWVAGLGFINVRFPKETTRELTQEEKDYYNAAVVETAGYIRPLVIP